MFLEFILCFECGDERISFPMILFFRRTELINEYILETKKGTSSLIC